MRDRSKPKEAGNRKALPRLRLLPLLLLSISAVFDGAGAQHWWRCPPFGGGRLGIRVTIDYLTHPRLAGRGTGTLGDLCAATFVASQMGALDLSPGDDNGDFLQPVPLPQNWDYRGEPGGAWNVVGVLRGTAGAGPTILVGAHHDHLGAWGEDRYYPGADDNASGVAALLGVATRLAEGPALAHTVVFVTFTGEEISFQGSRHYVRHPTLPLERTRLMINLDMVGRLREAPLAIRGLAELGDQEGVLRSYLARAPLPLQLTDRAGAGSDHQVFLNAGVPSLYVTTGFHSDRHRFSDVPEKLNLPGIEEVADLVAGLIRALEGTNDQGAEG